MADTLVFNCGSSSLKAGLFDERGVKARGTVRNFGAAALGEFRSGASSSRQAIAIDDVAAASRWLIGCLAEHGMLAGISVIGHRVVHGGDRFSAPVLLNAEVLAEIEAIGSLAPLHNPAALSVIRLCAESFSAAPQVAVFDTGYFSTLPEVARSYALPQRWVGPYRLHRYGFHGIAHRHMAERARQLAQARRIVTFQLGRGCSAAAIADGLPQDTSMGFTPLEGLIMGSRGGDVDPGVIVHLVGQGVAAADLAHGLSHEAGLLGLSGVSGDMLELLALAQQGHAGAERAIAAFCYRARKYVGSYSAVLAGIDAIVFGGGIGENAPVIRSRICADMQWLGLELDAAQNAAMIAKEGKVSTPTSRVSVWVIPVDEEEAIAKQTNHVIAGQTTVKARPL